MGIQIPDIRLTDSLLTEQRQVLDWQSAKRMAVQLLGRAKRNAVRPLNEWNSVNRPFNVQTEMDHSNTRQVRYSDPHCILKMML